MYIQQLDITGIRNLQQVRLPLCKGFNIFYGENGSGKTSLLEAIYILAMGKSFRTANLQQIINFEQLQYVISAVIADELAGESDAIFTVGTEKKKDQSKAQYIINAEKNNVSEIAKMLPLHLINSISLELVDGSPILRRSFIDHAMFHVEHSFLEHFHNFKRSLTQRNAVLKTNIPNAQKIREIEAWDEIFLSAADAITIARKDFVIDFAEIFNKLISGWKYSGHISFQYKQGWADDLNLHEATKHSQALDLLVGCTNRGPHRAELEMFIDGIPAKNVLSRGQQKVFVCGMILAKALYMQKLAEIDSIFLVDDLSSELDRDAFQLVIDKLIEIGGQVFLTGIELEPLLRAFGAGVNKQYSDYSSGNTENFNDFNNNYGTKSGPEIKLFHVEHYGAILQESLQA